VASKLQVEQPQLWNYWVRGDGLARWASHTHPWTQLHRELLKEGVPRHMADGLATEIYIAAKGHAPNEGKGRDKGSSRKRST
jgi:hypothetical protein